MKRDKYDKTLSEYVRARDNYTCQCCGEYVIQEERETLHCAHIFPRWSQSVRYNPENCLTLCVLCHNYFGIKVKEFKEFAKQKIGIKKFEELQLEAGKTKKWWSGELDEIRNNLLTELELME